MKQNQFTQEINKLHGEAVKLISHKLSPLALKYQYSHVNLENKIKWKPFVLILGNYSSGKSTLINEFLGLDIQKTGQAPTDDSFTVITGENSSDLQSENETNHLLYEKSGHSLISDPSYPFESLQRHGETLASHFKLKVIRSEKLKNLAIVDTPGMLDTSTEKERGYHYQEVLGELASLADVVLVFFDAHKAGTIKESYQSLRNTLPNKVFEDRVIYVLNRIDECSSLEDLIKVYGTLCWNLSQITGRKDIPRILLTYSQERRQNVISSPNSFLEFLENQQDELIYSVLKAPKKRLEHLVNFCDEKSRSLEMIISALLEFTKQKKHFYYKSFIASFALSGILSFFFFFLVSPGKSLGKLVPHFISLTLFTSVFFLSLFLCKNYFFPRFLKKIRRKPELLMDFPYQRNIDTWNKVKNYIDLNLVNDRKALASKDLVQELSMLDNFSKNHLTNMRSSLNQLNHLEIQNIKPKTKMDFSKKKESERIYV